MTYTNKFIQTLITTAMRFYAKKSVYYIDNTVKKYSNFREYLVKCDKCNINNPFFNNINYHYNCLNCRLSVR